MLLGEVKRSMPEVLQIVIGGYAPVRRTIVAILTDDER